MEALKSAWDAAKAGFEYTPHLRELHLCQLMQIDGYEDMGINHVRIVASGPGGRICLACNELGGKILSLGVELENPSLPRQGCLCTAYEDHQTGFCLCYYECVFDDEL